MPQKTCRYRDRPTNIRSFYPRILRKSLLIWLVDDEGNPLFFVTGLLDVRTGKLTKEAASELDKLLQPQITCEQPLNSISVRYEGMSYHIFYEGEDYEFIDEMDVYAIAKSLIENTYNDISKFSVTYAECDDDYLSVHAAITACVQLSVPWQQSEPLRPDQIAFLRAKVAEYTTDNIGYQMDNVTVDIVA